MEILSLYLCQLLVAIGCDQVAQKGWKDGVYLLTSLNISGYCETIDGLGWLVLQRRMDGSVDFYQDFATYESGFGDLTGEFWLGNFIISQITANVYENWFVRFDLTDINGKTAWAEYDNFGLGPSSFSYSLSANLGPYNGTSGDSFSYHAGYAFTTADENNSNDPANCAVEQHGAWWWDTCQPTYSELNGLYGSAVNGTGIYWYTFSPYSLKACEIKTRMMYTCKNPCPMYG